MTLPTVSEELIRIDKYFKTVVDKIPSYAYFTKTNKNSDNEHDEQLTASGKKAMVKRKKLNPANMKTTSEILENDSSSSDDADDAPVTVVKCESTETASTLQDLHKRLQQRLDEIKAERMSKKRTPEETLAIQQRRKVERAKYKEKKKRQKRIKQQQSKDQGAAVNVKIPSDAGAGEEKKVMFSKFEFGNQHHPSAAGKKKKKKKSDFKSLLNAAEKSREKMAELKRDNPERAVEVEQEERWKKALVKSTGTKVKDDVKLLKKSMKKRDSIKKQSREKWREREKKVEEKMKKKGDRRERNIRERKANNKAKKFAKGNKRKTKGF